MGLSFVGANARGDGAGAEVGRGVAARLQGGVVEAGCVGGGDGGDVGFGGRVGCVACCGWAGVADEVEVRGGVDGVGGGAAERRDA